MRLEPPVPADVLAAIRQPLEGSGAARADAPLLQPLNLLLDLAGEDGVTVVEASAEARMVRAAVDSLPPEQRDVVALVMLEELCYREAADLLGLPIGTVMSRLSRAKAALAKRIAGAGAMQ